MTASSTILRVKRRLDDSPQDAFILMCKRARTDTDEVSSSLFVFQETVDDQDNIRIKTLTSKYDSKLINPSSVNDIVQKIRKERKESSVQNRYEVVNFSRNLKEYSDRTDNTNYGFIDLQQKGEEKDSQYAYDLYIAAKPDFDVSIFDNIVSIENYETNLIFGSHRDNGRQTPSSNGEREGSDDSNDENNWRNEYPDTENSSIDEEDMVQAMERCDLDDLSSDTGEDKIYDNPPDLFSTDADCYGIEYAKYKARVLAEDPENKNKGLIYYSKVRDSDEKSLGYKDDSDDGFYYGQEEDAEQFQEQYKFNQSSDECDPD